jgi:hypothetical protein
MEVVLVCTGNFQSYILQNIQQLKNLQNHQITVITESEFFDYFPKDIRLVDRKTLVNEQINNYLQNTQHSRDFRGGFWIHCFTRFLYIYQYMKNEDRKNIIHLENDVMTYFKMDEEFLQRFNVEKDMYIILDNPSRCIPGLIFIRSYHIWEKLFQHINYHNNDMDWLSGMFRLYPQHIDYLPIIHLPLKTNDIEWNHQYESKWNCIFDAAAMGQYLGGVDPRNISGDTVGFVNTDASFPYNGYRFQWQFENDLWVPYLVDGDKKIKIMNLHIHSKNLDRFLSSNQEPFTHHLLQKS